MKKFITSNTLAGMIILIAMSLPGCSADSASQKTDKKVVDTSITEDKSHDKEHLNPHKDHSSRDITSQESGKKENGKESKESETQSKSESLEEGEYETLKVTEAGLSLSVLSSVVYGTSKRWPEIAEWNHLKSPYHIRLGQKLLLKKSPHLNLNDVNDRILNLWRAKLNRRVPHNHESPGITAKKPVYRFHDQAKGMVLNRHGVYLVQFMKHKAVFKAPKAGVTTECLLDAKKSTEEVRVMVDRKSRQILTCRKTT